MNCELCNGPRTEGCDFCDMLLESLAMVAESGDETVEAKPGLEVPF
jgi:hypothetical protein